MDPVRLPNELFDRMHDVLARFGYAPPEADTTAGDWASSLEKLRADFAENAGLRLPAYDEMTPEQRAAAEAYIELRVLADRRLAACERCNAELYRQGIDNELVELYTAAREAYEDTVEAFGTAREHLAALLVD